MERIQNGVENMPRLTHFDREGRARMGTWVYGCDRCQEACPRNQAWTKKEKPVNQALLERVKHLQLTALLTMDQEHYERRVWPLLYYVRKEDRKIWQRNAAVALGNQGDTASIPVLTDALEDGEPLVRTHAAWALGRIGGGKARGALERKRKTDPEGRVREEIELSLEGA